jgi:hypothetical protein
MLVVAHREPDKGTLKVSENADAVTTRVAFFPDINDLFEASHGHRFAKFIENS